MLFLRGPEPAVREPKVYNKNVSQSTDLRTEICELLKDGKVKVPPMNDSTIDVFIRNRNTTL